MSTEDRQGIEIDQGSFDKMVDSKSSILIVKWFDNATVKRWSSTMKQTIEVRGQDIVMENNSSMGGVDLMDILLNLILLIVSHRNAKMVYALG